MHRWVRLCFLAALLWTPLISKGDSLPNFVIVLADDLGWGDPQCYQAESRIPTPAMDRLAEEGWRFTDAHTPSSVCTPTRYSLLTGRYAWRTRLKSGVLDGFDPPLIGEGEDTLASLLKRAGYQTHCLGKWHLGMQWTRKDGTLVEDRDVSLGFRQGADVDFSRPLTGGPIAVGFDTYFGISASLDMSPYCWIEGDRVMEIPRIPTEENRDGLFMNQVPGMTTETFRLVDVLPRLGKEAARIIREAAGSEKPFFCYVPLTSPHLPVVPTPDSEGRSEAGEYGDFVVATDQALGAILRALDETDQADNTLVLFTSDNGGLFHWWDFRASDDGGAAPKTKRGEQNRQYGHRSNAGWRGTKADIFEGGHRVPFLVRWPAKGGGGKVVGATIELTDIFATLSEIVGEPSQGGSSGMDSFSLLPLIEGSREEVRPFAVHHSLRGLFALRRGDWKYIEGRGSGGFTQPRTIDESEPPGQLYHLAKDPQETVNRYQEFEIRAQEMRLTLKRVRELGATEAARSLPEAARFPIE